MASVTARFTTSPAQSSATITAIILWPLQSTCVNRHPQLQGRRHGVDMPTPLLPEGVPEIDADPLSLEGRCGVGVNKAQSVLLRLSIHSKVVVC